MSKYVDVSTTAEIISNKLNIPLSDLIDIFAEIPTAAVKEVVNGEWGIEKKSKFNYDKCSVCGFDKPSFLEFRKYAFCPKCGADMRGNND